MIYNSMHEGEMAIYNAGVENIPIIKNEDLQELGKMYSKLNVYAERMKLDREKRYGYFCRMLENDTEDFPF